MSPRLRGGRLQAGDRILRYAGGRVYGWSDLCQASSAGEAGALVPIQIERDGRILDLSIERGPLGIRLGVESVHPEAGFESPQCVHFKRKRKAKLSLT